MVNGTTGPSMLAPIGGEPTGSDLWRVLQPFARLAEAGYACRWAKKTAPNLSAWAPHFDGYVLPRFSWPPEHRRTAEAWFASIRSGGKLVVCDADDDIFTAAQTWRQAELGWTDGKSFERLEAERFERIWAMQQCDGVTVSTEPLAEIVRSFTSKPVIVVPNAIDLPWFRGVVRATGRQIPGLTIGWAGGRRHDRDVEQMAEAWGRIAGRYPDVTFVVQGHVSPVILENVGRERLSILPWMSLERYPSGLAQIDIACAAVADTPFNRAKSQIKVMEAAAAGSAVVASPFYAPTVDDGVSGLIAESVTDWEIGLSTLIECHATRQIMARRLFKTVEREHSLAGNLNAWTRAWAEIAESARIKVMV